MRIHFERYGVDIKCTVRNTPEIISKVVNQLYRDVEIALD